MHGGLVELHSYRVFHLSGTPHKDQTSVANERQTIQHCKQNLLTSKSTIGPHLDKSALTCFTWQQATVCSISATKLFQDFFVALFLIHRSNL